MRARVGCRPAKACRSRPRTPCRRRPCPLESAPSGLANVRWRTVCGAVRALRAVGIGLALTVPEETRAMFDNIFGIHEQALAVHGQRLGVLAANIANADTPGYKARDIDFSEVLSQSETGRASLPLKITQAAHITFSDA